MVEERSFGSGTSADLNGNGRIGDTFPLLVAKGTQGWFVVFDTDEDGDLGDERPVTDYLDGGSTFTVGYDAESDIPGPVTFAVNIEPGDPPDLRLVFDNSGHGTHVAGIAAGSGLYGVDGFDGVAPGASLLGLKIADNTRGGITTSGSILRALNYAADFAARRGMPLVVNISFGIGHGGNGGVAIDSIVDEFALKHPDVLVVISAGNDGPGISSMWLPASARHALSVCAMLPGVFAREQELGVPPMPDALFWWSSRGGRSAKPDVCAPGVAYSALPRWRAGDEISLGTSMAAPHIAGIASILLSGIASPPGPPRAVDLKRALVNTATVVSGSTILDLGGGVANAEAAFQWLQAQHRSGVYRVEALQEDGMPSTGAAAYRRNGLRSVGDTVQLFRVTSLGGQPAARLDLASDAPWMSVQPSAAMGGTAITIPVTYDAAMLTEPGLYVGTVRARPATDMMAGPSFELANTVIVPHDLHTPVRVRGDLSPGIVDRHFFRVPEPSLPNAESDARAVVLSLTRTSGAGAVSVHLFEPSGRPARGGRTLTTGDLGDSASRLVVLPRDPVAGVYEAAVVGPDAASVSYELRIMRSPVRIVRVDAQGRALVRNDGRETVEVSLSASLRGVHRTEDIRGGGRQTVNLDVPRWADRLHLEVAVDLLTWSQVTDFGITVYDGAGWKVVDAPLNYPTGRISFSVADHAGRYVAVEFAPAFAHLRGSVSWSARLQATFAPGDTIRMSEPAVAIRVPPGAERWVYFARPLFDVVGGAPVYVDLDVFVNGTVWSRGRGLIDPIRPISDSVRNFR